MKIFRLHVKKTVPFFIAIIDKFCEDSFISLKGDLSAVSFSGIKNLTVLKDKESIPELDHIIFSLTEENALIFQSMLPRIGIRTRIIHILIEQAGNAAFASYDQFDKDATYVTAAVGETFIKDLLDKRILWKYEPDEVFGRGPEQAMTDILNIRKKGNSEI
jgi:hypothetical protein